MSLCDLFFDASLGMTNLFRIGYFSEASMTSPSFQRLSNQFLNEFNSKIFPTNPQKLICCSVTRHLKDDFLTAFFAWNFVCGKLVIST